MTATEIGYEQVRAWVKMRLQRTHATVVHTLAWAVLAGVADFLIRPFFDLTILASWEQVLRLSMPLRFASRSKSATTRCQTRRRWYFSNRRLQVFGDARMSCGLSSHRHP